MKYQIVTMVDGQMIAQTPADILAWAAISGRKVTGYHSNPRTHAYMQGQPEIQGLIGPMGNGPDCIRYEDQVTYNRCSA